MDKNVLQIVILYDQARGELRVHAPMNKKVEAIGMLEMAKQQIMDFDPNASKLVGATAIPSGLPPAPSGVVH